VSLCTMKKRDKSLLYLLFIKTFERGSCKSIRIPPFVIPNPSLSVVLREQSDRKISLRVNSVRNLLLSMSHKTPRFARGDIFGTFAGGSKIKKLESTQLISV